MPDDWQKNLAPENVQIHSASPLVVIVFRFRLRLPAQFAQEAHRPGLLDHIVVVTLGILFHGPNNMDGREALADFVFFTCSDGNQEIVIVSQSI